MHQGATSKVDCFLAVAIIHLESLNQDLLLVLHFSDHGGDSTLVTIARAQPERIFDLDIVCMNGTDQELVFFVTAYIILCSKKMINSPTFNQYQCRQM